MSFNVAVLCVASFLVQCITAQNSCSCQSTCQSITVSNNGGPLTVSSIGPIAPSGIAVATDLSLSGDLDLSGALPFLSAVAFEGQYPTSGSAAVSYGCGDTVAITQEIGNPSGNVASSSGLSSSAFSGCGCRRV